MTLLLFQAATTLLYFVLVALWVALFSGMCKREKITVICWMTCVALTMYGLGTSVGKRYVLRKLNTTIYEN